MAGTSLKQRRDKKVDEIRDLLIDAQHKAAEYMTRIQSGQEEPGTRWADRTVMTHVNIALVDSTLKAERTKTMADSNRQLGLVMIPMTIPGNREWERYAVEATKQRAIEAEVEKVDGE